MLPHDIMQREFGSGGRSRYEVALALGIKPINVGIARKPTARVSASRSLLPFVKFRRTDAVRYGVNRLRNYRRRFNDALQIYMEALHDENSHAADAFGEFAVNCPLVTLPKLPEEIFTDPDIEGTPDGKMRIRFDVREYLKKKEREARREL